MELVANPVEATLHYLAFFKKPIFDELKESKKISLARKFVKIFHLSVNDLKYNQQDLSSGWINFSKFVNPGFFDVSFGIEKVSSSFRKFADENQLDDYQHKFFGIIQDNPIDLQRMTLQQQLATGGDLEVFLNRLNPYTPGKLKDYLVGKGVIYDLEIKEHNLTIQVSLSRSQYVKGGLFFWMEAQFLPNVYDCTDAFKVGKKYYQFILSELNLKIERTS